MSRTILSFVFFAGAVIVGVFYARPQWSRFSDLSREVSDLLLTSRQYDDLVKNRDAMLSALNAISKDNLDRVDAALPLGAAASEFLVALESYTVSSGVTLKRADLASPSDENKQSANQPLTASVQPGRLPFPPQPKPAAGGGGGGTTAREEISELPFSVEVAGSYEGIKKFLAALERNVRIIDASEISFNAPAKAGEPFSVNLKAKTYYQ